MKNKSFVSLVTIQYWIDFFVSYANRRSFNFNKAHLIFGWNGEIIDKMAQKQQYIRLRTVNTQTLISSDRTRNYNIDSDD